MEFKPGDKVRIEGVLESHFSESYPIKLNINGTKILFTKDGKLYQCDKHSILQLVERPKKPVPFKYWEEGKRYKSDAFHDTYIVKEGLPYNFVEDRYSNIWVSRFIENDFYEVVDG